MVQKISFLALLTFMCLFGQAQTVQRCHTMEALEARHTANPGLQVNLDQARRDAAHWRNTHPNAKTTGGVLTIPVVVHVLHSDPIQNITDAQIQSQIDVLNQDFRRLNPDTVDTRPEFDSIATDMEIQFCMASVDPLGNPTNGINRVTTTGGTAFGFFNPLNDDAKSTASGGVDPWPTDQYLNIWVCDLIPIVLGYAQFPGDDSLTDGVVIGYNYFGTTGTVSAPYNQGRTTVHEVGHWLGLYHIWGDGDCTADDSIPDTPNSDGANQGGCFLTENSCVDSGFDYPDMVENYMDYSDDGCMNMFTHGQKARAWSFLNTARASLFTSNGCSIASAVAPSEETSAPRIYPNPGTGIFQIQWPQGTPNELNVQVLDLTGKNIWNQNSGQVSKIDLTNMPAGIYIVRIKSATGIFTQKLLLQ